MLEEKAEDLHVAADAYLAALVNGALDDIISTRPAASLSFNPAAAALFG